ncbi:ciliary neurotrophic factor receptor subunit alpha-like isoform X1 [Lampetra fluviatilis]
MSMLLPLLPLLLVTSGIATPAQELRLDARAAPLTTGSPPHQPQPSQGPLVLHVRLGDSVNLSCRASAHRVTWRLHPLGGAPPDPTASSVGPPVLVLQSVHATQAGKYECLEWGTSTLLDVVELRVGEPPAVPVLHCRSRSYPESFTCSWSVPGGLADTVVATYWHASNGLELPCPPEAPPTGAPSTGAPPAATVGACTVRDPVLFSTSRYRVSARAINAYGHSRTATTFFLLDSIVKPDPPIGVTVTPVSGQPRQLLVTWQMPPTWPNDSGFQLLYVVRSRHPQYRTWRVLDDGVDEPRFLVKDARPGVPLLVEVAARDRYVGEWSVWSGWGEWSGAGSPWVETTTSENVTTAGILTASPSGEWGECLTTGPPKCTKLLCSNLFILATFLGFLTLITASVFLYTCRRRLKFLALRCSGKGGSAVGGGVEDPPCSTPLEGVMCSGGGGSLGYHALKSPSGPVH